MRNTIGVLGAGSIVASFIIQVILLSQSGASLLMDSKFKQSVEMMNVNPGLFALSAVLFFGGFVALAVAIFGGNLFRSRNTSKLQRQIVKREKMRQEALRKQAERQNNN